VRICRSTNNFMCYASVVNIPSCWIGVIRSKRIPDWLDDNLKEWVLSEGDKRVVSEIKTLYMSLTVGQLLAGFKAVNDVNALRTYIINTLQVPSGESLNLGLGLFLATTIVNANEKNENAAQVSVGMLTLL
jgi:hypothetical protein